MGLKGTGNPAMPPYNNGPYQWDQHLTLTKNLSLNPERFTLTENFAKRPQLNATIDQVFTVEAARACNQSFEILGTNASDDDVIFSATVGGIQLQTDGGSADQIIVLPHLDTNLSAWTGVKWGTENQVIWEAVIRTGAIATLTIWAGLKLTNTEVVATDDDQVYFRFDSTDDTVWKMIDSIAGTDTATASDVTVAANTNYHFRIEIDSSRKAHFFINDDEKYVSGALTDDVDLIPYIGVQSDSAATDILNIVSTQISRIIFE